MTRELHLVHRPTNYKQVVGQAAAVSQLVGFGKAKAVPHCLLFTGPSGCGKTTLARITRTKLGCGDADFTEMNCASTRGIDAVRLIQEKMGLAPISGRCRVYLVDECHQLTADAQGAFLKILEEPPDHVYFMLATTDPQKLRTAIITRCTEIKVSALSDADITAMVKRNGGDGFTDKVLGALVEAAGGSARKALVLLAQCLTCDKEEDQLQALQPGDAQKAAIEICRALLRGCKWPEMCKIIKAVDDDPEGIRHLVLAYLTTVALGGGNTANRACAIMEEFMEPFFYTKKAGLVLACHAVCTAGGR